MLNAEESKEQAFKEMDNDEANDVVDVSILSHVLDLLCSLLKNSKTDEDKEKVVSVFP